MPILAQVADSTGGPNGWIAVGIQLFGGGGLMLFAKWMMGLIDTKLTAQTEAWERNTKERADSNANLIKENAKCARETAEAIDRMGRSNIILVLALHQVDEALKTQAKELLGEFDDAQKARDKAREREA